MAENITTDDKSLRLAHEYAWDWFAYHADQRLKSFNFFFVLEGALTAAYLTSLGSDNRLLAVGFGFLLLIAAIMFWRLDTRNSELIKISEQYLMKSESILAAVVGQEIRLAHSAENADSCFSTKLLPSILSTYRKIFRAIFVSVILFSIFAIIHAIHPIKWGGWLTESQPAITAEEPKE
ncbi:hypothetical protein [Hoeflea sp.]|uniref:hypothetical protein n=1 Tax=Hoeflea sp. TaxID=1940281 RepID=UPI003A9424C0